MNREILIAIWASEGVPAPDVEYRFHSKRRWRFDYAWPATRVALEIEGGVWVRGRHIRPAGFLKDIEKYNAATCMGWAVLRCVPDLVTSEETISSIRTLQERSEVEDHTEIRGRIGRGFIKITRYA